MSPVTNEVRNDHERFVRRKEAGQKNRVFHDGNAPAEGVDSSWQCLPDKEICQRVGSICARSMERIARESFAMHGISRRWQSKREV